LGYLNYTTKPKKAKTIAYTVDGEDKLWELTTKQREIDFVEHYSENETTNDKKPDKSVYQIFSFEMVKISVGFKWMFNGEF